MDEIPKALKEAEDDREINVIVLSHSGPHFGAGYDLAVRVKGVRDDGTTVIEGSINLWISPKKG